MSHLLGGRIRNWVSPGSQDVERRSDESCFLWRHCRWLHEPGGVHRTCPSMVTDESVYGRHGWLGLIRCRLCQWLIHLHRVWSQVRRDHQRCRRFAWLWRCTCSPGLEETTFTQETGIIRTASLFAQWAGLGWTVGPCVSLVWSSVPSRFTIVTKSGTLKAYIVVESHEQVGLVLRTNLCVLTNCSEIGENNLRLAELTSCTCSVGYNLSIKLVVLTHVLLLGICLAWSLQSCSLLLCLDIRNTS